MKFFQGVLIVSIAIVLSGCSGESGSDYDVYYLTDDMGNGMVGIPYDCASGESGETDRQGAFGFDPSRDSCDFDLTNVVEDLYIMDEFSGVNGLDYECVSSGISGVTGDFIGDGSFDYNTDDTCTIEF